jgi:hypothetical protein
VIVIERPVHHRRSDLEHEMGHSWRSAPVQNGATRIGYAGG